MCPFLCLVCNVLSKGKMLESLLRVRKSGEHVIVPVRTHFLSTTVFVKFRYSPVLVISTIRYSLFPLTCIREV